MKIRTHATKPASWLLSFALLLATVLTNAPLARADVDPRIKLWTAAGSTGTIDEADTGKLVLSGPTVAFPDAPIIVAPAPSAAFAINVPMETVTATIRYNVTATDATVEGGEYLSMRARFRDEGANSQVLLRLIEMNMDTGATTLLLTLDSNAFTPQTGYQSQSVFAHTWYKPDFISNVYYVEATLIQKRSTLSPLIAGHPGLAGIQLYKTGGPIT